MNEVKLNVEVTYPKMGDLPNQSTLQICTCCYNADNNFTARLGSLT
jgi:hypothetical protein